MYKQVCFSFLINFLNRLIWYSSLSEAYLKKLLYFFISYSLTNCFFIYYIFNISLLLVFKPVHSSLVSYQKPFSKSFLYFFLSYSGIKTSYYYLQPSSCHFVTCFQNPLVRFSFLSENLFFNYFLSSSVTKQLVFCTIKFKSAYYLVFGQV